MWKKKEIGKMEREELKREVIEKYNIDEKFVDLFINDYQNYDLKDVMFKKLLVMKILEKHALISGLYFIS